MEVLCFGHVTVLVDHEQERVITRFPDGKTLVATPEDTEDYRARAAAMGLTSWQMCWTHEVLHALRAALRGLPASPTLWHEAGGPQVADAVRWAEEEAVMGAQAVLAAGVDGG